MFFWKSDINDSKGQQKTIYFICKLLRFNNASSSHALTDSKGYLLDEDGFDYVKFSLLRDIKAQQRSLRFGHVSLYLHIF